MTTWADVKRGDVVELKGAAWLVVKAKRKGKAVKVTVKGGAGTFAREVKAKTPVTIADEATAAGPLRDARGAQRRWATDGEATAELGKGEKWSAPASDKVGKRVESILGGKLAAQSPPGVDGYAVPLIELTTVRAHLAIFHALPGPEQPVDDAEALAVHKRDHETSDHETRDGWVAHWHSKRRPAS